ARPLRRPACRLPRYDRHLSRGPCCCRGCLAQSRPGCCIATVVATKRGSVFVRPASRCCFLRLVRLRLPSCDLSIRYIAAAADTAAAAAGTPKSLLLRVSWNLRRRVQKRRQLEAASTAASPVTLLRCRLFSTAASGSSSCGHLLLPWRASGGRGATAAGEEHSRRRTAGGSGVLVVYRREGRRDRTPHGRRLPRAPL
ncbi:unnamed protein product, partial [Ectocarpus sp. 8 AP-2014]